MTTHILLLGDTQSGKTFFANQLHRTFKIHHPDGSTTPGLSIFWNANRVRYVWGHVATSIQGLKQLAVAGVRHINYLPPENKPAALAQLDALRTWLFQWGQRANAGRVWVQVLVDEVQRYTGENLEPNPIRELATRGLGLGIRLVAITQYPKPIDTTTRTNLKTRIFFDPGMEGGQFLATYQYPREIIESWTRHKHYWVWYVGRDGPHFEDDL